MVHAVDGQAAAPTVAGDVRCRRSHGRSVARALAAAGLLMAAVLVGGCASQPAMVAKDPAEFSQVINRTDQPVLMMFFKQGCPACARLEPTMDQLAGEYNDRAVVSKFMVFSLIGTTSPEIRDKYEISLVPTVILFVKGQQRQKWVSQFNIQEYRKALNEVVGPAPAGK